MYECKVFGGNCVGVVYLLSLFAALLSGWSNKVEKSRREKHKEIRLGSYSSVEET